MSYRSFEDLEVWKKACRLAVDLYKDLEESRDYGLKNQMTRAAVSIASNIAEGSERKTLPEYIQFLYIAKGSAGELRTQVYIAQRIELIPPASTKKYIAELKEISSMLYGLIKKKEEGKEEEGKKGLIITDSGEAAVSACHAGISHRGTEGTEKST